MAKTIDAHHHLWRFSEQDYGWITPAMGVLKRDFIPADLEVAMREAVVDGSIAVQARQSLVETRWLLAWAETNPSIKGVVGWLPIADADFATGLSEFRNRPKLKGLRHVLQDEPDDNYILREDFNAGISALRGTGLVYDILIHERHLPQAAQFVKRHPHQAFVLDHLAKPKIATRELEPWRENLTALASSKNVSCKLSGLVTEANWASWTLDDLRPYLDHALEVFGADRLMAGSDWPVCLVASGYKQWWDTLREWTQGLTREQQDQILGGTADRVYRLHEE